MCLCFGCINGGPCKTTNPQQHALWKSKVLKKEPDLVPRKNKYGNVRSQSSDGQTYSSKLECAVAEMLKARVAKDEIYDLREQQTVRLTEAGITYKADFSYRWGNDELVYVEAKGVDGARWRIIKKLWRFYGPAPLEVWKGTYKRPELSEVIER